MLVGCQLTRTSQPSKGFGRGVFATRQSTETDQPQKEVGKGVPVWWNKVFDKDTLLDIEDEVQSEGPEYAPQSGLEMPPLEAISKVEDKEE